MSKMFLFLAFWVLTTTTFSQQTVDIRGKYCEDLGFGWYCIDFQKGGEYREVSGHSSTKYKATGKWFYRNDTLLLVSNSKKTERDTSYFVYISDTLYSVYFNNKIKQIVRGKPLIKQ